MRKEIKQHGNSVAIVFTREDLKMENMDKGDIIDFTITKIIKQIPIKKK